MADRQKLPLPFGDGIDRASGAMVADPTVFNDIRNVHLTRGRAEMRKGLLRSLVLPAPWTDLLGTYLIRAQGLAGAIGYNSATREVGLFAVDSSGVAYAFIEYLWTLPAGATSPPRISATDSYDQLVIAHDEPIYPVRQETMVYSAVEATIAPLMLDLGRTGTPEAARFRGVRKHLAYIVGWGYGTNEVGQGDRGEVLRISMPGEPTNFVPEHYFLVGTQGDPIIGCGAAGGDLAVHKIASTKKLVGYDRATFAIRDLDPAYGLLSSRLTVSVNDEEHFWSLSGPRVTTGGASVDLGLPLELAGSAPDPAATATLAENGFAYYDATEREIVYVFGQWGYVLHLKDGNRRWSYRKFAFGLVNAGLLYIGGGLGLANITAHPEPHDLVYIEPTYAPGDGAPKITVPWNNVGGDGVTTETAEVWVRSQVAGSPWRRKYAGPATAMTATFAVDAFWTTYDVAVRFTSGGFAGAGYVSSNPLLWPAVSRTAITTGGTPTAFALGRWQRFDSTTQGFDVVTLTGPGVEAPASLIAPTYRIEKTADGGATWTAIASGLTVEEAVLSVVFTNSESLLTRSVRIRAEGPHGNSAWLTDGPRIIAPEVPTSYVEVSNDSDAHNDHPDTHNVTWAAPAAVNGQSPDDGPYELRARHFDNYSSPPPNFGAYGTTVNKAVGVHAAAVGAPGFSSSGSVSRTAGIELRVNLPSGDVSPWLLVTTFEA
jgi:hypothetical protein